MTRPNVKYTQAQDPAKPDVDITKLDWTKMSATQVSSLIDVIVQGLDPHDVTGIHRNADSNQRTDAMHHTLGGRTTQASPGDHIHDGGTSAQLLTATISGVITASPTAASVGAVVKQILTALAPLGITDATT